MHRALRLRFLPLAAAGLAFWPVWVWFVRRMTDGSDEPWGLAALLAAAAIVGCGGQRSVVAQNRSSQKNDLVKRGRPGAFPSISVLLIAIYAAAWHHLPDLGRAVIAMTALALLMQPARGACGVWGLLLLSLPVMASVQFFAGYPLRRLTTEGAALLLRLGGAGVTAAGTVLRWRGETVAVDVPCSGVTMLWGGVFLACALCAWMGSGALATTMSVAAASVTVVAANLLRATALFIKETGLVALPAWTHEGIGLLLFAGAALLIATLCQKLDHDPRLPHRAA